MQHILSTLNQFQRLRKYNDNALKESPNKNQLLIIAEIEVLELTLLQEEETLPKNRKNKEQQIIALLINHCSQEQMTLLQSLIEKENTLKSAH